MSHYSKIETRLTSAPHLLKALKDMGFSQVEYHDSPVNLVGFEGSRREDTAEIVIRKTYVGSASNDIGFKRSADGSFAAIISDFDSRHYDGFWLNRLSQRYSYHVTRDTLEQKGFDLIEEEQQSGEIRLTLRRMT